MADNYRLSKGARREISVIFRDIRGDRLTKKQKEWCKRNRVDYGISNSAHAYLEYEGTRIAIPLTPGDRMGGRVVAKRVKDLLEGRIIRNGND